MKIFWLILVITVILAACAPSVNSDESSQINKLNEEVNALEEKIIVQEEIISDLINTTEQLSKELEAKTQVAEERFEESEHTINRVLNQLAEGENTRVNMEILNHFISGLDEYSITYGFVEDFSMEENRVDFDDQEWINVDDMKRIDELGIDVDMDFPNGFYLYNEVESVSEYSIEDSAIIYTFVEIGSPLYTEHSEFEKKVELQEPFCKMVMNDGEIIAIIETYIP